jgi:hypothetical protein
VPAITAAPFALTMHCGVIRHSLSCWAELFGGFDHLKAKDVTRTGLCAHYRTGLSRFRYGY